MGEVTIIARDINGRKEELEMRWSEVSYKINNIKNDAIINLDEYEILLILVNNKCIYSSLASPSITWDDVIGFFA